MSSQILVYGFIEITADSQQRTSALLESMRAQQSDSPPNLLSSISGPIPGWLQPTLAFAFAKNFKKYGNDQGEELHAEFLSILRSLDAFAGRLHIEDDEGIVDSCTTYLHALDGSWERCEHNAKWHRNSA